MPSSLERMRLTFVAFVAPSPHARHYPENMEDSPESIGSDLKVSNVRPRGFSPLSNNCRYPRR